MVAENLKFVDLFNLSIVSKRFYHISRSRKKFVSAMRISKYIFGFDDSYFKFLCSEFRYWGNIFMKSLKKQLFNTYRFANYDINKFVLLL